MNKSLIMGIATVFATIVQTPAFAGHGQGNGGNAVVCRNENGAIIKVELLDYFENRLRTLKVDLGLDDLSVNEKIKIALSRLYRVDPLRAEQYQKEVDLFFAQVVFVDDPNLELIFDFDYVSDGLPEGCQLKQLAIQRQIEEPAKGQRSYTVNRELWNQLDANNQAGLVLHEIIYRDALRQGHKTSFAVRAFNVDLSVNPPYLDQGELSHYVYMLKVYGFRYHSTQRGWYLVKDFISHRDGEFAGTSVSGDY